MGTRLYVGNLGDDTKKGDLEQMFAAHGTVTSALIPFDRETQRPKNFGFVDMESDEQAQAAIAALNGTMVNGKALKVNEARPQEPRSGGGGGGGGAGPRRGPGVAGGGAGGRGGPRY